MVLLQSKYNSTLGSALVSCSQMTVPPKASGYPGGQADQAGQAGSKYRRYVEIGGEALPRKSLRGNLKNMVTFWAYLKNP